MRRKPGKPVLHNRDHEHGGADPVRIHFEDVGDSGGGGGGLVIADEGTPLPARGTLDFVGAGVTATDDAGADTTTVTIPGGGGGGGGAGYAVAHGTATGWFSAGLNLNEVEWAFLANTVGAGLANSDTIVTVGEGWYWMIVSAYWPTGGSLMTALAPQTDLLINTGSSWTIGNFMKAAGVSNADLSLGTAGGQFNAAEQGMFRFYNSVGTGSPVGYGARVRLAGTETPTVDYVRLGLFAL